MIMYAQTALADASASSRIEIAVLGMQSEPAPARVRWAMFCVSGCDSHIFLESLHRTGLKRSVPTSLYSYRTVHMREAERWSFQAPSKVHPRHWMNWADLPPKRSCPQPMTIAIPEVCIWLSREDSQLEPCQRAGKDSSLTSQRQPLSTFFERRPYNRDQFAAYD